MKDVRAMLVSCPLLSPSRWHSMLQIERWRAEWTAACGGGAELDVFKGRPAAIMDIRVRAGFPGPAAFRVPLTDPTVF